MSSKASFELVAELRDVQGKGASRRLRRLENRIPAIMYGGGQEPTLLSLDHKKVMHALEHEAFYSHILTLQIDGKAHQVILKALQRHVYKRHAVNHMDFLRIRPTDSIHMRVPIHFLNADTAAGLKEGGVIKHHMMDIDIRCMASALPEYIEIDLSDMQLHQTIHLSDLKLATSMESVVLGQGNDQPIVSLQLPRLMAEEPSTVAAVEVPTTAQGNDPKTNKGPAPKGPAIKAAPKDKGKGKGK